MKRLYIFVFFISGLSTFAQDIDFYPPLDIPLYLAGNFGELRSNHFHTGLDIKTQGKEGLPIYSSEDGYVSRIKVSLWGYGNALYITHPNGYTTVYAHLQSYNEEITSFLRMGQYNEETYAIDLTPGKGQLVVVKGQEVGLSGNSGSSGGPHLHYEIRETDTEFPVNPMLFGFDIKDDIPPVIDGLLFEPLNDSSFVNGRNASLEKSADSRGEYMVKVWGEVGLAISTFDRLNGQSNKCGTYDVTVKIDNEKVYSHKLEKLDFGTNRHVNAHINYAQYKLSKKKYQRCFILPGNKLKIYQESSLFFSFRKEGIVSVSCSLTDVSGNEKSFIFNVKVERPDSPQNTVLRKCINCKQFRFDSVNSFRSSTCTLFVPEGRLYRDFLFEYEEKPRPKNSFSLAHKIGTTSEPLQNKFTLKIEVDNDYTGDTRKLLIAQKRSKGKWRSLGGRFNGGWMEAKPKEFGEFVVKADTLAPIIQNINLKKDMSGRTEFSIKITDDFSGIEKYRAEIDGQWVLMEYQPKRNRLTYKFDQDRITHGDHSIVLFVSDERKNEQRFEMDFSW